MTHLGSCQCVCNSTRGLEDDGIEPSAPQELSYLMDFHCVDQLRSAPIHVEGVGRLAGRIAFLTVAIVPM